MVMFFLLMTQIPTSSPTSGMNTSWPSSIATATTPRIGWMSAGGTGSSEGRVRKWRVDSEWTRHFEIEGRR
jgi:hypothetical protein